MNENVLDLEEYLKQQSKKVTFNTDEQQNELQDYQPKDETENIPPREIQNIVDKECYERHIGIYQDAAKT